MAVPQSLIADEFRGHSAVGARQDDCAGLGHVPRHLSQDLSPRSTPLQNTLKNSGKLVRMLNTSSSIRCPDKERGTRQERVPSWVKEFTESLAGHLQELF